jgi:hypothetical protein|tara:strand:+ start:856 stop:1617 length:762 start_codon:yes stop_codon:yes gene_type:complete
MYLDVNQTIEESINLIKEKIRANTPFALSRYGDGEIYFINRNSPPQHQQRGCRDWGYDYPSQLNDFYDDSSKIILNGITNSDVIGIMDKNNDIAKSINYTEEKWSIKKSLLKDNEIDVSNLVICDHMLSRAEEFGRPDNFKEILQGKSLNIISPNTEILKTKNLDKLFESDVTFTHHPYNVNLRNRDEFINSFKNIKSEVVLVGCGIQKDYVSYLKHNNDKIAIDVGALLDAWSGLLTRPWFRRDGKQDYLVL